MRSAHRSAAALRADAAEIRGSSPERAPVQRLRAISNRGTTVDDPEGEPARYHLSREAGASSGQQGPADAWVAGSRAVQNRFIAEVDPSPSPGTV